VQQGGERVRVCAKSEGVFAKDSIILFECLIFELLQNHGLNFEILN
jgi:hypothetical protein